MSQSTSHGILFSNCQFSPHPNRTFHNKLRLTHTHKHTNSCGSFGNWEIHTKIASETLLCRLFLGFKIRRNSWRRRKKLTLLSEPERNSEKEREDYVYSVFSHSTRTYSSSLLCYLYTSLSLCPLYVNEDDDWDSVPWQKICESAGLWIQAWI